MIDKHTIVEQLKESILKFTPEPIQKRIGTVVEVGDGIVRVEGLADVAAMEMLMINDVLAVALNLEKSIVGAIILGDSSHLHTGMTVEALGKTLSVPVTMDLLGRVTDALMKPKDNKGTVESDVFYPIEKVAPGVIARKSVSVPLQTGIKVIDSLIPIGRGQRELIIGDRQTGKTALAIDTILNQKGQDVICIYVAIGQKESKVRRIVTELEKRGALSYTTIVSASASEAAALQFLAPYAGCALAEFFMDQGKDVLIVYDDLSKQANAYREISLLLRRPPGREAYPGDVFYLHSRLLERAARLSDEYGGGSITALPIIETQAGDISAYIPTNVISITDGQIFLESDLFYKGVRPAVNVGSSVSRVGSSAQTKAMKKVAGKTKLLLAQFRELESFAQFGSDLDEATRKQLELGRRISEILKQPQYSPESLERQIVVLYAAVNGYMDSISVEEIPNFVNYLLNSVLPTNKNVTEHIKTQGALDAEIEQMLQEILSNAVNDYK